MLALSSLEMCRVGRDLLPFVPPPNYSITSPDKNFFIGSSSKIEFVLKNKKLPMYYSKENIHSAAMHSKKSSLQKPLTIAESGAIREVLPQSSACWQ